MSMGSAVHAVFQKYLGLAGILYGSWTCGKCKKVFADRCGPVTCCGEPCTYQEIKLNVQGLHMRADGLIQLKKGLTLVEVKTSTLAKIRDMKKPWQQHVEQVNVYGCAAVKRGYPVKEVWLWYIPIDSPHAGHKVFSFGLDPDKFISHLDAIRRIREELDKARSPKALCHPRSLDPFCNYNAVCQNNRFLEECCALPIQQGYVADLRADDHRRPAPKPVCDRDRQRRKCDNHRAVSTSK
jgi:hypothetical protein